MGQRKYPLKTQTNWVFVLYPVRGNKLEKKHSLSIVHILFFKYPSLSSTLPFDDDRKEERLKRIN